MSRLRKVRDSVRYASGATGVNLEKWLTWGVIAGGGLLLYKVWSSLAKAGDAASKTVADAYVRATAGPVIEVLGKVVLPNGQKVPLSQIKPAKDFTFVWGSVKYRLTTRRPDNDYDSVRV